MTSHVRRIFLRFSAGGRILLACCAIVTLTAAARAQPSEPAVIRFQNREITILRATLGPMDPKSRVESVARRLSDCTPGELRQPVSVVPHGDMRAIFLGERTLFVIVPEDVDPTLGQTLDEAAAQAADKMRAALTSWADQRRPDVIVRGVLHVLAATIVGWLLLMAVSWLRRALSQRMTPRAERAIETRRLILFGQDLRHAVTRSIRFAVNILHVLAALLVLYAWLMYSLRQFPLTEPWSDGLADFLLGTAVMIGLGILRGIPEMIIVVLVLVVTRFFAGVIAATFNAVERGQITIRGIHADTADASRRIATALIWVFGVAVAYPFIPGSGSEAFKGISVLVGLMISLGSSGLISQAMSGMVVVFSRALKAGEYVCIGEYEGTVSEVGALSTKLRTKRNEEINIPNALLVSNTTKNYSRLASEHGLIVYATAGIGYDAPWRVVHRLLVESALRTPGIRPEPPPFVRQSALTAFCVDYTINAYIERPEDRLEVLSNLHASIQDAFNEAGIQIMTPAFENQPAEPIVVPRARWDVDHDMGTDKQ